MIQILVHDREMGEGPALSQSPANCAACTACSGCGGKCKAPTIVDQVNGQQSEARCEPGGLLHSLESV